MATIQPEVYFSGAWFYTNEHPQQSFLEVYFSELFWFDYDKREVKRESTNEIHKISKWNKTEIKFERFKL